MGMKDINFNLLLTAALGLLMLVLLEFTYPMGMQKTASMPEEQMMQNGMPVVPFPPVVSEEVSEEVPPMLLFARLNAQNNSGISGNAVLFEANGKLQVAIAFDSAAPEGVQMPAHIHKGTCENLGEVVYPLTNILNGASETELAVTVAELRSQFPLAVNVHRSAAEASVYVACGDLE